MGQNPPPRQKLLPGRHPSGQTSLGRLNRQTPPGQTSPRQTPPLDRNSTPLGRHPPLGYYYGQQAGGTHPTGMHTCLNIFRIILNKPLSFSKCDIVSSSFQYLKKLLATSNIILKLDSNEKRKCALSLINLSLF